MTTYTLPDIVTVDGTFKVQLFSDTPDLEEPTVQTIKSSLDVSEVADRELGISEIPSLTVDIMDDHNEEVPGFWYQALQSTCYLYVTLDDSYGDSYYFYGVHQPESASIQDIALVGSTYMRTLKVRFVSMLSVLFDANSSIIDSGADTYAELSGSANPNVYKVLNLKKWIASLLEQSGLNTGDCSGDVSFIYDANKPNLKFKISGTPYGLDVLYCAYKSDASTFTAYFASGAYYLPDKFSTVKEFLAMFTKNFGFVIRMSYSSGRHKIEFVQRTRAYSGTVTFGGIKSSEIRKAAEFLGDTAKYTAIYDEALFYWLSCRFGGSAIVAPRKSVV